MSKPIKIILIVAASLVIIGGILSGIGFAVGGMKSVSVNAQGIIVHGDNKGQVQLNESYPKISSIEINTSLLKVKMEEGDSYALTGTYDSDVSALEVSESNGKLVITENILHKGLFGWNLFNFGFGNWNLDQNELIFTYPKNTHFDDVEINNDLGNLKINELETSNLTIGLDAGALECNNISADSLNVNMNLGNCNIDELVVADFAQIKMDAGSLTLNSSNINNLELKMNLGSCNFSGLLEGNADLSLDLGSMTLDLENKENELGYRAKTDLGSIHIDGQKFGSPTENDLNNAVCTLNAKTNLGSITIHTK